MSRPPLSIIVVSYDSQDTIDRCLEALSSQETDVPFEIIAVTSGTDRTADIIEEHYPNVRLIRCGKREYPGAARNIGVSRAASPLIGFVDSDCIASPDWVEHVVQGHRGHAAILGGVVDNANPESPIGWIPYFCEFNRWMPGTPSQSISDLPTCCFSFKREIFRELGGFRELGYGSDTAFCWAAGRASHEIRFDPSIRVKHLNIASPVRFVRKQVSHGRDFARMRVDEQDFSTATRLFYIAVSPLLPPILLIRLVYQVFGVSKTYRLRCLLTLPLIICGLGLWSLGEFIGYCRPRRSSTGSASGLLRRACKPSKQSEQRS